MHSFMAGFVLDSLSWPLIAARRARQVPDNFVPKSGKYFLLKEEAIPLGKIRGRLTSLTAV